MIRLIPAIDIIDGRCVRLTRGDYATEKVYADDPAAMARQLEDMGFRSLHVVDLDGARLRHVANLPALERIAQCTGMSIDFGGGITTANDVRRVLAAGARQLTIGSMAVRQPETVAAWIEEFGAESFILGADVREGHISINGWKHDSDCQLMPFLAAYAARGMRHVLCTDITRDGMLQGPATELYASIMREMPGLDLIASGGVGCTADIEALAEAGIPAVVFGKAIYEGRIDLADLMQRFPQ